MTPSAINNHLRERLRFVLAAGFEDSADDIRAAWPKVSDDGALFHWNSFVTVTLSQPSQDAIFEAASYAYAQLLDFLEVERVPVEVASSLIHCHWPDITPAEIHLA